MLVGGYAGGVMVHPVGGALKQAEQPPRNQDARDKSAAESLKKGLAMPEQAEQAPAIRVDEFVQAVNASQIKRVRLEDLSYPVEVRDDGDVNLFALDLFTSAAEVMAFVRGYMWGTVMYPEVPPLRLSEVSLDQLEPLTRSRYVYGKTIIVELRAPLGKSE